MAGIERPAKALTIGVHVLDTLVRPVETIPAGQGGALVEQITVSPAGTAGATGLVLSKLGAQVRTCGVAGDDPVGALLKNLLERDGVDTSLLHVIPGEHTSASVLPIRPDGSRPALHAIGANQYLSQYLPWDELAEVDIVHLGGPEFYGGRVCEAFLRRARDGGAITAVDSLAPGNAAALNYFEAALPEIDYLLPNDEQVLGWTGASTLPEGCLQLIERGARCVVATAGAAPTVVATADSVIEVPSYPIDVVDTSGCGDAFSAGFLRGITLDRSLEEAARLGNATAAQVAQGLGSDFGLYDLDSVQEFITTQESAIGP
ncbi:carbohydrate kinase family protein [Tsukamurella tyrosinosolvens]|uniref:carbohydrate kinase family protein n=1 Tax=Tsukamurella tyrosinosolvens TaxID=57704 RepID=UPI002DD43681|nr:PfkB family carbohydrate kinase [Tsukamurella tyrosinosolvens]MEC4616450.1 PfkB family carbohydrate kinase [Tsukamurella tyrosinosolvens]